MTQTRKIKDLPVIPAIDDADEVIVRDVSASDPAQAVTKTTIADLRAAIGGGDVTNPLSEDLDADGHNVVGLPSYDPAVDPPPSDMSAAVSALTMNNAFNFLLPRWASHKASEDVDMDGHDVVGLPTYSGSSPPADLSAAASFATLANAMTETVAVWATAPASQDVDMDGHKITGLGEPTDAADAATKGYVDARLPELEWWDPVWTPFNNVDSVSNVECQYTRVYRAAGGSLVTLEGTIEVEIDDDGAYTSLTAPLPVPATSTGMLLAPAIGLEFSSGVQAVCVSGVADFGSGTVLMIGADPLDGATGAPATLTIGFRVSYRAA